MAALYFRRAPKRNPSRHHTMSIVGLNNTHTPYKYIYKPALLVTKIARVPLMFVW